VKDEFLSLVSHELRTPIAVILGNSHVLKKRAHELSESDRTQAISDIAFEAERLQRIIENLLLLTRVEGGERLEIEVLHLERVANRAIEACRRRSPFRRIEFNIAGKLPPALGEATLTALVFENLITNADKYSPEDRPIEVRLHVNEAGSAEVHVLDHGIGLGAADVNDLFTPFYRTPAAKDRSFGMGLGLAVCKKAIEEQGGAIGAAPRIGGGSDFWFTLPLAPEAEYD
jgi:two-component system sensor histidine kinase KdpD